MPRKSLKNDQHLLELTRHLQQTVRILFFSLVAAIAGAFLYFIVIFQLIPGRESNALSWSHDDVDTSQNKGDYSSIALNSSGYPIVSYYDNSNSAVKYAVYDGASWTTETVDNTGNVGTYTSIAWDSANARAIISYYDAGTGRLRFAMRDGGVAAVCTDTDWSCEQVDNNVASIGQFTSITFLAGAVNKPAIAYRDGGNGVLKYAIRDGGVISACTDADWSCETVDSSDMSANSNTSIIGNSSAVPVIVYTQRNDTGGADDSRLLAVTRDDSADNCAGTIGLDADWGCEIIDTDTTTSSYAADVNLNGSNNLEVVYRDPDGVLQYEERTASNTWSQTVGVDDTIAGSLSAGADYFVSLTNGNSSTKMVSYSKGGNTINFAIKGTSSWGTEQVQTSTSSSNGVIYSSTTGKIYISYQDIGGNDMQVAKATANTVPVVGYSADDMLPAAQISQSTDGTGLVTVQFRVKDAESNSTTLSAFAYSVDDGSSWNTPASADSSDALYKTSAGADDWDTNGATGSYSSAASFAAATTHSFYWYTKHATEFSGLNSVDQSDVKIRFKTSDGTILSSYGTSESLTIDNLNPAAGTASNVVTRPNAGESTITISGTFTENHPNTNTFYAKINSGSYGSGASGTTNTASPSNQSTTLAATLDGDDCIGAVKITHVDDYGNSGTNENTSPSLACAVPYTPDLPTSEVISPNEVRVFVNAHDSETGAVEYAIYETNSAKYVQTNGTLGTSAVWQTFASWGGASGVLVSGLSSSSSYIFKTKARNPNDTSNTETAFSGTVSTSTTADRSAAAAPVSELATQSNQNRETAQNDLNAEFDALSLPTTSESTDETLPENNVVYEEEDPEPSVRHDRFLNLTAVLNDQKQITLQWIDPSVKDPKRIEIYRNYWPSRTALSLLDGVAFGKQTYTDTRVEPGKAYYYRVIAFDDHNNAITSDIIGIKVPAVRPSRIKPSLPETLLDSMMYFNYFWFF